MTPFAESSTQTNERPKSHITLIRKVQEKAFEDMQWELFVAQVIADFAKTGQSEGKGPPNLAAIKPFVKSQLEYAHSLGLSTAYDQKAYVFCAWRYGEKFEQHYEEAKQAFATPSLRADFFRHHVYQRGSNS
ncbi:hypothetical protein SAMN04488518_1403 [Pseudovibrio ascidiaceicola]|uniref:Uncharacterized protein n=1 Tax=Pseudovibrio ascidiaceicola TaxID=285279 RepID=A0A1I4GAT3_9HYPH|nr:hypothetical protein [Pseudovibrio ascidiaceicola]SFL27125.1 hypothetical protein SAMN04488518_1403 [Pseudovibrio ascidiaceicola]